MERRMYIKEREVESREKRKQEERWKVKEYDGERNKMSVWR